MKKQLLSLGIALLALTSAKAQKVFVDEDFDSGSLPTGWTNTAITGSDVWQFGKDASVTEPGESNIDSTNMAYFDDDDLGQSKTNNTAALTTPAFDNALFSQTTLAFDYNFREFGPATDSLIVEVFDGTKWVQVFSVSEDDCGRYVDDCKGNFPRASIRIDSLANANCQVRFVYHDGNDFAWHAGIDNVSITAPLGNDVSLAELIDPIANSCGLKANHHVTAKIINKGSLLATNFLITVDINNGEQILTETVLDSLTGGDSINYVFNGTVDMEEVTDYDVTAYVTMDSDGGRENDTFRLNVTNNPSFDLPYFDGFEVPVDSTTWRTYGLNNSWELGFPNSIPIGNASQGSFAWVTNLDTSYNNFEKSYLESPCIDLSNVQGDPYISFDIWYATASVDDSITLELSTDNGVSWDKVEEIDIAKNWYNTPPKNSVSWANNSGGYVRAEGVLDTTATFKNVKVRFQFSSDSRNFPWNISQGVAIDAVNVDASAAIDLSMDKMLFPKPGANNLPPECGYGKENILVEIHNRGYQTVDSFEVFFQIDNDPVVREKVLDSIRPFSRMRYEFDSLANFSGNGNHRVNLWVRVNGEMIPDNDTLLNQNVNNIAQNTRVTPLRQNFNTNGFASGTGPNNQGFTIPPDWAQSSNFTWRVANSGTSLPPGAGPNADHTGNSGNFIYTEPREGTVEEFAVIQTPCLNFANAEGFTVEFWYHAFGTYDNEDGLIIDVFDGFEWIEEVDKITFFPQANSAAPWTFYKRNFAQFAGKNLKVRFRLEHVGPRTVFAIDDLVIYEPIEIDGEVVSINGPLSDCSVNSTSTVEITVRNFGTDSIKSDDSLRLVYQVINGLEYSRSA